METETTEERDIEGRSYGVSVACGLLCGYWIGDYDVGGSFKETFDAV